MARRSGIKARARTKRRKKSTTPKEPLVTQEELAGTVANLERDLAEAMAVVPMAVDLEVEPALQTKTLLRVVLALVATRRETVAKPKATRKPTKALVIKEAAAPKEVAVSKEMTTLAMEIMSQSGK